MNYIENEIMNGLDNFGGNENHFNKGLMSHQSTLPTERASFDVKVKRLTANLSEELPFAIFGACYAATNYTPLINVPSGLTLVVSFGSYNDTTPANQGKVQFSYTDGTNTDIIEVTTKAAAPYPALLQSSMVDLFQVGKLRISLSDASQLTQLDTDLAVQSLSLFGKSASNVLSISSSKSPDQQQSGIVDIDLTANFNKETAFVGSIIAVADFTVTHTLSITRFNKRG